MARRPSRGSLPKLTAEEQKTLYARHGLYLVYRREAKRHSVASLARDLNVDETTVRRYIGMRPRPPGRRVDAAAVAALDLSA